MCFTGKKIQAKSTQDKSGNWLKVENFAVKGTMAYISTGATIFQANVSKFRRPLETVDLEELPDSREGAEAPVLWHSCEGQIDVWEMFSDNSYLSAIHDWQGLLVAAPIDLRTKKAESFSPQLLQNFWFALPYFGTRVRKDLMVEKRYNTFRKKVPLPMDPPAWQETQVDFSQSRQSFASTGVSTSLA